MGVTSGREQTEAGGDLTEQIRGQVDAAEQLLQESAKRVRAAAERVRQAELQAEQAKRTARLAQEHIDRTRARAARAKDRELAIRARAWYELALEEQAEHTHSLLSPRADED
jgi:hypothetical protein